MILKKLFSTSGKRDNFPPSSEEDKWINICRYADKLEKRGYKQKM